MSVNQKEEWLNIPIKGLSGTYQMSSKGGIKTNPYRRFKKKELVEVKEAYVITDEASVYLNRCKKWGWYSVSALYFATFGIDLSKVLIRKA